MDNDQKIGGYRDQVEYLEESFDWCVQKINAAILAPWETYLHKKITLGAKPGSEPANEEQRARSHCFSTILGVMGVVKNENALVFWGLNGARGFQIGRDEDQPDYLKERGISVKEFMESMSMDPALAQRELITTPKNRLAALNEIRKIEDNYRHVGLSKNGVCKIYFDPNSKDRKVIRIGLDERKIEFALDSVEGHIVRVIDHGITQEATAINPTQLQQYEYMVDATIESFTPGEGRKPLEEKSRIRKMVGKIFPWAD